MKKVLFCAAMVAAMSMAFVACGKKNKNAEENQDYTGFEDFESTGDENVSNPDANYDDYQAPENDLKNEEEKAPVVSQKEEAPVAIDPVEEIIARYLAACDAGDVDLAGQISKEFGGKNLTMEQRSRIFQGTQKLEQSY